MKIEHIAIWVKDIDKVCEFYRKYFGGNIHPLYHNPKKQFTSRFVTFEDGARLEIMHRPDICQDNDVGTLTESKSDMLMLDHGGVQAPPHDTRHRMFHVEHLGIAHISFSVGSKEKVDLLTKEMSEDGVSIVGEPRTTGDGYYESVVLDPEGNRIEITV
ncbi:VOC family protein [Fibrobacter sp.]|uniref:VOC family protein n=1 Tax=Fibrobacter sp. TaxID=35828 RepID=UPI00386B204A